MFNKDITRVVPLREELTLINQVIFSRLLFLSGRVQTYIVFIYVCTEKGGERNAKQENTAITRQQG